MPTGTACACVVGRVGLITPTMGRRGERPVTFQCPAFMAQQIVEAVPGTVYHGYGIACTWDAAPIVADMLGEPTPAIPDSGPLDMPGLQTYRELIGPDTPRKYQKEDALFLARRSHALLCNPMRSGKSFECLIGATLAGVERGLIVCPSISKWVWADEIAKWLHKPALLLDGLSRSEARLYCLTCMQRGRLKSGKRCPDCRARNGNSYGYVIYEVRQTEPPIKAIGGDLWRCRKHPDVTSAPEQPQRCRACAREMFDVLQRAPYVIINYELLMGQASRDKCGRTHVKQALRGWADVLQALNFELAILDECHYLRGFTTLYKMRGKIRKDIVKRLVSNVPIVWGVTGTPIFGFVRDLYGQLDVISNGLWGTGKDFTQRYSAGHPGPYGWIATGHSNEEELRTRLSYVKIQRPRSEILAEMPAKQRSVFRIEYDGQIKRRKNGTAKGAIAKMIAAVAPIKRPYVIANVMNELAEGMKTYVLTYRRNACEAMGKAIEKEMAKREWRKRMEAVNAEIWVAQTEAGISAKARFEAARAYREHEGAAVIVATIDSMPGSLSLKGATSVHMADFHTSPSAMEQAEDRPFEPGSTGLSIIHYVVNNSIDEDLEAIVIPKFEAKDKLLDDENAQNVLGAFRGFSEEETMEAVWERHTAHLVEDDEEDY